VKRLRLQYTELVVQADVFFQLTLVSCAHKRESITMQIKRNRTQDFLVLDGPFS
jgi:hypothetical protein